MGAFHSKTHGVLLFPSHNNGSPLLLRFVQNTTVRPEIRCSGALARLS